MSRERVTVNLPDDVIDRNLPDSVDVDVSAIDLPDGWELSARQNHKVVAKVTGAKPDNLIANAKVTVSPKDRKSTRLNSSHVSISYAVFCLKKTIFPGCLSLC